MRTSTRLLLVVGGLLAANCLVWGTFLAICGCALGSAVTRPSPPPAVVQATPVHRTSVHRTNVPRLSPSPIPTRTPRPTRTPTLTPASSTWSVNPTASWPTRSPAPPTPTRPTYTPTPWPTQVIQGSNAEAKARALVALAATDSNIPFRVIFTEREIEQEIERYLAQQPEAPYRNVTVTLKPHDAVVSGQVKVSGLWVTVTIHADVTARDGKPVVTITGVDLGSFPLPPSVKEDLNKALVEALAEAENLPFRFTAITLGTGRITVQGVTR